MKIRAGHLFSLVVVSLMTLFTPSKLTRVHGAQIDEWWNDGLPYRLPVVVDGDGIAAVNIDFTDQFASLGLEGALLDVRSIRVVPYHNGVPGDAIPYEETYSTLVIDGDSLNMNPESSDPYWSAEDLFTLNLDTATRFTQGTGSIHAHFKFKQNAQTRTEFKYDFNDPNGRDWSDYEALIYDVFPIVNDSAVDQSPDIFLFELNELTGCPVQRINAPALVMNEWNHVSVSLNPYGNCSDPDMSTIHNVHFIAELELSSFNEGWYGDGDEFDLWLDNFRLVDQDGDGEIRWEAEADVDKYYIYFDTLDHEGHTQPETLELGEAEIGSAMGEVEAGGYFHLITGSQVGELTVWSAPIEEKILRSYEAPISSSPLTIHAARSELEAFQIVINSPETRELSVEIGDLSGDNGIINASQVELFRVDYIDVTQLSDFHGRMGSLPDPLYPVSLGDEITFPSGENQPLWFRIRVPSDAKAGLYSGTIRIGSETTVPISLEVWDFILPQDFDLDVEFGFDWDAVLEAYGAINNGVKHECYNQVREVIDATFEDYHILPLGAEVSELPENVLVYTLTNYEVETAHTQQIKYARQVWLEFVSSDKPPFANPAVIDRNGLDARILPWMAWLDRVDGIYYAQSADWDPNPWSTVFSNGVSNGDGFLFYPPNDDTLGFDPCNAESNRLVPSIRLELLREGLEDYAYLWLLNGQSPEIDLENAGDIFAGSFIGSRTAFTRIPTVIDSTRVQVAELLQKKDPEDFCFLPLFTH